MRAQKKLGFGFGFLWVLGFKPTWYGFMGMGLGLKPKSIPERQDLKFFIFNLTRKIDWVLFTTFFVPNSSFLDKITNLNKIFPERALAFR